MEAYRTLAMILLITGVCVYVCVCVCVCVCVYMCVYVCMCMYVSKEVLLEACYNLAMI